MGFIEKFFELEFDVCKILLLLCIIVIVWVKVNLLFLLENFLIVLFLMDNGGLLSKVFFDWLFVLEVFFGERVFEWFFWFWNGIVFERLLFINEFLKYELRFVSFKLGFVEVFIVVFIWLYVFFFI